MQRREPMGDEHRKTVSGLIEHILIQTWSEMFDRHGMEFKTMHDVDAVIRLEAKIVCMLKQFRQLH